MDQKPTGTNNRFLKLDKTVTLGNLLVVLVLVASLAFSWFNMGYRVMAVEAEGEESRKHRVEMSSTMVDLDRTLALLEQRLTDYPLHQHNRSGELSYPGRRGE